MTKSTITRERLEQLADNNTICKVSWDERIELAQIALSAMDSEPVAYADPQAFENFEAGNARREWMWKNPGADLVALYRHAHPAPVVMDDEKLRALFDAWFASDCSFDLSPEASEADNIAWRESYWYVWQRCRTAMLQAVTLTNEGDKQAGNSPANPGCWCRTCRPVVLNDMRFVVCPDCGNKRCPRANDHRNACTGSNEPGQEGSAYPADPQEVNHG